MPMFLELFSGTGSVSKPFRENGWDVISVDLDHRYNPEIVADIMTWDYTNIQTPDIIWASPPCILYSIARTRASPPDLDKADELVSKTLEILAYFTIMNPDLKWFIENPDSGKLKHRDVVQGLSYVVLDYCMYGALYRKRTRIWTNTAFVPKPLCVLDCNAPKYGMNKHYFAAQRGGYRHTKNLITKGFSLDILHALPHELCCAVYNFFT
jgi:hypothetical protein